MGEGWEGRGGKSTEEGVHDEELKDDVDGVEDLHDKVHERHVRAQTVPVEPQTHSLWNRLTKDYNRSSVQSFQSIDWCPKVPEAVAYRKHRKRRVRPRSRVVPRLF